MFKNNKYPQILYPVSSLCKSKISKSSCYAAHASNTKKLLNMLKPYLISFNFFFFFGSCRRTTLHKKERNPLICSHNILLKTLKQSASCNQNVTQKILLKSFWSYCKLPFCIQMLSSISLERVYFFSVSLQASYHWVQNFTYSAFRLQSQTTVLIQGKR